MTNSFITGISPFTPQSTFRADTIQIPRGMFLGGRFYSADKYVLPCHISYISESEWGIADSTGAEVGVVRFDQTSGVGDIYTPAGEYAGCLKGKTSLFNDGDDNPPDLTVFRRSLTRIHTLDADTLVWDINCCSYLYDEPDAYPITKIVLPVGTELRADDNHQYYIAGTGGTETGGANFLRTLTVCAGSQSVILNGRHLALVPMSDIGIGDIVIAANGDTVLISNHGNFVQ